jgi:hypothetical protein
VALMLAGLQFGLIVGAIAGPSPSFPMSARWSAARWPSAWRCSSSGATGCQIGVIAAIFAVGQFIEGNILTPKLVGKSVGLHPVWLLFALSAFGSVFGFVGMLVAVPVAASIGVLTRFAVAQYQASLLYRGVEGPHPARNDRRRGPREGPATGLRPARATALDDACDFFVSPVQRAGAGGADGWRDWPGGKLLLVGPGLGQDPSGRRLGQRAGAALIVAAATWPKADAAPRWPLTGRVAVEDIDRWRATAAETALFPPAQPDLAGGPPACDRDAPAARLGPRSCPT